MYGRCSAARYRASGREVFLAASARPRAPTVVAVGTPVDPTPPAQIRTCRIAAFPAPCSVVWPPATSWTTRIPGFAIAPGGGAAGVRGCRRVGQPPPSWKPRSRSARSWAIEISGPSKRSSMDRSQPPGRRWRRITNHEPPPQLSTALRTPSSRRRCFSASFATVFEADLTDSRTTRPANRNLYHQISPRL
jgi:hypothetical protein